jgi:hypothetical protein
MTTRPCSQCGVQIHPASRRCILCGATQAGVGWAAWTRWVAGLAGLAAVVVAAAAVSGGSSKPVGAPKPGGPRFRLVSAAGLTTLVPVGWTGRPHASGPGTVGVAFGDLRQPRFALSVTAERPARGTARARAAKFRAAVAGRLDFAARFFGRILFPGGRPAWLVAYDADGSSHAAYIDTACVPGVAMRVEVSGPDAAQLRPLAEPIAASAGPRC